MGPPLSLADPARPPARPALLLRELRELNLGWCGAICDADMWSVGQLRGLQSLQISYTQVGTVHV